MNTDSPLSIEAFPAWVRLNDVEFINAQLQNTKEKGIGLVTLKDEKTIAPSTDTAEGTLNDTLTTQLRDVALGNGSKDASQEKSKDQDDKVDADKGIERTSKDEESSHTPTKLLQIPRDLVLSATAVEDYTKVDQNFRQLLEVAGHEVRLQ